MKNLNLIELKVERLDKNNFAPYGEIIGSQKVKADLENEDIAFYPGVSNIELTKNGGMLSWLEIKKPREFICENLERHLNCTECLIPFGGSSIIVTALSKNINDPKSPFDIESSKAFFIDGSTAINFKKGVWHWAPFPISLKAFFIVVFEKETHINDLEIIDLKKDYSTTIKLMLEK